MSDLGAEGIVKELLYMLQETVESPPGPGSAYLDQGTGLYDTLAGLSLEQLFHTPAPGRPSIAQHVRHVSFHMNALIDWIGGQGQTRDWPASWVIAEPSQATWDALLTELRLEHGRLRQAIADHVSSSVDAFGGAVAAITHVAYHLGAIRQLALLQKTAS